MVPRDSKAITTKSWIIVQNIWWCCHDRGSMVGTWYRNGHSIRWWSRQGWGSIRGGRGSIQWSSIQRWPMNRSIQGKDRMAIVPTNHSITNSYRYVGRKQWWPTKDGWNCCLESDHSQWWFFFLQIFFFFLQIFFFLILETFSLAFCSSFLWWGFALFHLIKLNDNQYNDNQGDKSTCNDVG